MITKIIGAFLGDKIARQTSGVGGATGAAIGVVASTVIRRMSIPAMLVLGAGGYAFKKLADKGGELKTENADARIATKTTSTKPKVKTSAT